VLERDARESVHGTQAVIASAVQMLRAGSVLAVKGIGGYHLICDACNDEAVRLLRERKRRPHKPLAVLFPQSGPDGLDAMREHLVLDAPTEHALVDPARPIVLARRRAESTLAAGLAPGLDEIGAFLPYSPLHHLLLQAFGGPLVATSGNVSGEPVLCDNDEARVRLANVADAFVHHDRRIARPADDSVMRVTAGRARSVRVGRGLAPLELSLPWAVDRPTLAVGGHMKTTIALAWGRRLVMSPHIGDMGTVRSEQVFAQVIADLQRLYRVQVERVVCDAHPGYATTRWARGCGLPVMPVLHHHAHASGVAGEHAPTSNSLVFAWDGTGLGADGTLWGGETFLGRPGRWQRVASLRSFRLPGGDRAARSPWRSAAAMCWEAGLEWDGNPADPLVHAAWQRGVKTAESSAVGRLFDAAAALVLDFHEASFEGQGPMLLESLASAMPHDAPGLRPQRDANGLLRLDWQELLGALIDASSPAAERADRVHAALARTIVEVAESIKADRRFEAVGLTGGVFQNRKLTELAVAQLEAAGFRVWLHERIPANDGGLSFGQIIEGTAADEAAARILG
jgi:hydrogenase maturation protein HypF